MTVNFSGVNNAVIFEFAEDCIIRTDAGDKITKAVFFAPYEGMTVAGAPVSRPDTTLRIKSCELEGISINRRDVITIHGCDYYVVSIAPDEAGITEITLGGKQ